MIPVKLELTNFLSYQETAVLDFEQIHLACIAGANGAGKSTLLDGITWVLFGRSRSKSDDDVVNHMASRHGRGAIAQVRLTFTLGQATYRVTRRKPYGKNASLDLAILHGRDEWKSLSQSKLRETQAEIEKVLRMNYDTFINVSFLLQGKADEFTTKTPNKRKEVLADLLGLGIWDQYKEVATDRRKQEEGQLALLDADLANIEAELGEEAARSQALAEVQQAHAQIAQRLADKQALFEQLQRIETAVNQQKKQLQNLQMSQLRAQKSLAELQKTYSQRQAEEAQYAQILAQADEIAAAYAAWQTADAQLADWQNKADAYHQLQQAKRPYEMRIVQEKSRLEQRLRQLQEQQTQLAQASQNQQTLQAEQTAVQTSLAQLQAEWLALAEQEAQWQQQSQALARMQAEHEAQQRELQTWQDRAKQMAHLASEQTAVQQQLQTVELAAAELTQTLTAVGHTQQQLAHFRAEKQNLEAGQAQMRGRFKQKRDRIAQLDEQEEGGDCPLCGQPLSADHRQTVLAELKEELRQLEAEGKQNNERIELLTQEIAQAEISVKQLPQLEKTEQDQQKRKAQLAARLEEIGASLADWQETGAAQLAALQTAVADTSQLTELKQQLAELATAVAQKQQLDGQRQAQERQLAHIEARLAEIDRWAADWQQQGQAELTAVQTQWAAGQFDVEAQTAVAELEAREAELGYDAAAHTAVRQARQAVDGAPKRHEQLQLAQASAQALATTLAELGQHMANQQQEVAHLQAEIDTAVADLERLTADSSDIGRIEDERNRLREEENEARRRVLLAENRLGILDDLRRRQQQLQADRVALTNQIQRLKRLETAFGREGVQSLLIEQAIPEIRDRTNHLLDRLTGGEMQVDFPTQKQNKSNAALRETLEIEIRDNAGARPYDNFSGGEQFRVNFAIRLALSQLLARRAGAQLQTLVIDEGFGSQDPLGRQRLVEAIHAIQDDFKVILVITHVDELRDAFPVCIQVQKGAAGSRISVV